MSAHPQQATERPGAAPEDALQQLRQLCGLARELSRIAELDDLLDLLLSGSLQMLRCRSGSVFLLDGRSGELLLAAARGRHVEPMIGIRQKLGRGISGRTAKTRQPALVTDIKADERFRSYQKKPGRYRSDSFLSVPLVAQDRLVGVMNVSEKDGDGPFTPADLELLTLIAHQAAGILLAHTAGAELRQKNQKLEAETKTATRELRLACHRLSELKNFNESIISSVPHGLVAFDRSFKVLFANASAKAMMQLPEAAGEAPPVCNWQAAEGNGFWPEELAEVLRTGSPMELARVELAALSGKRLMVHAHVTPLRDAGRVFGGLLALENLEGRLQIEERLKNSERLAVLGRLAAKVAHELNTPLDGVRRFVKLSLRLGAENADLRRYLEDASVGLDRMSEIIASLLQFSRSAQHRFGQVQVNTLLREAISLTDHLRVGKNIRLRTQFDDRLPATNYANLTSVFTNLIKNAYDAVSDDGTLLIRSMLCDGKIALSFSDNGSGIPSAFLTRIFDPFFTTKKVGKGTGLGLAICKDIVESYEGQITVETEEGKGSTFTVLLPLPSDLTEAPPRGAILASVQRNPQ